MLHQSQQFVFISNFRLTVKLNIRSQYGASSRDYSLRADAVHRHMYAFFRTH